MSEKVILTCAVTGLLTDPAKYNVPVTPEEMVSSCREAYDAGASVVHLHFRNQTPGMGHLPTWEPEVAGAIVDAIRAELPDILINQSTGVLGSDISAPVACLDRVRPEMAALNAGTLNYLKIRKDGNWAWPPMIFDNPIEKVAAGLEAMKARGVVPECECFDTGILRSVSMYVANGMLDGPYTISLVMGVASGMPAKGSWLPLLVEEMPPGAHWQTIGIGRTEVWDLHRKAAELGGHLRTGLEDTFYLPDGSRAGGNGVLIETLATIAREAGREIATPEEARSLYGLEALSR